MSEHGTPAPGWGLTSKERRFYDRLLADGFTPEEAHEAVVETRPPHLRPPTVPAYGPPPQPAPPSYGPPQYGPSAPPQAGPPSYGPPAPPSYQHAPAPPTGTAATGMLPYALGFLAYLPIPIVSLVVAGIVMASVKRAQSRRSPLAAENARRAANWGLTVVTVVVVSIGSAIGLTQVLPVPADPDTMNAALLPLLGLVAVGVAHLFVCILGAVRARQGQVFANPLAIPFFRR